MLGIIFTRKRLFAAWSDNGLIKWIPIGLSGKNYIFHSGEYLPTLQNHFNHIYRSAQWHAFGNGMTPLESPSLALVFPGDDSFITASEKQVILNWITSLSVDWSAIRSTDLSTALSYSLPRQFSDFILFEALDEGLKLYSNIPAIAEKIPQLDLQELGIEDGTEHIYNVITEELKHKNLVLPDDALTDLRTEIDSYEAGKKLLINFTDNFARISIDLSLSPSRYYDLLTWKRDRYFQILSFFFSSGYPECTILFVSDLFDNPVFRDYIRTVCSDRLPPKNDIRFVGETEALEKIIQYLSSHTVVQGSGGKSGLLAEIKAKCTDRRKYRDYLDKYLPLSRKLGLPDDMIIWQIRQSINSLQKLSEIGDVVIRTDNDIPQEPLIKNDVEQLSRPLSSGGINPEFYSGSEKKYEKKYEKDVTPETEKPFKHEPAEKKDAERPIFDSDLKDLDRNLLLKIAEFAVFEEKIPDREFISFRGRLQGEKKKLVFRVLKNNVPKTIVRLFEKLHDREKSYYKDCSSIRQTASGELYFYRPFFEGELLETYVKRTGLHKKFRLKDISALDLELMLELWRIIYRLKFSFDGFDKDSFIVGVQWRLPLKREIDVKLINIDTSESDKQAMETKMTEIFQEIFGENLTNEFKKQFRNH